MEKRNTTVRSHWRYRYIAHRSISTDDFPAMLERAQAAGVKSMIITGGSLHESREALKLAQDHGASLHPDEELSLKLSSRSIRDCRLSSYTLVRV